MGVAIIQRSRRDVPRCFQHFGCNIVILDRSIKEGERDYPLERKKDVRTSFVELASKFLYLDREITNLGVKINDLLREIRAAIRPTPPWQELQIRATNAYNK